MSRYWVFTEEQLEEALRTWLSLDGDMNSCVTGGKAIRDFLSSPVAVSMGMARDIAAPAAPELRIFPRAGETELLEEPTS